jgi:hypothetical protein
MNRNQIEQALHKLGVAPTGFTGEWVQARCPFATTRHGRGTDRAPSFGVKVGSKSVYNCLACKSKGLFVDLPKDLGTLLDGGHEELSREFLIAEATGLVVEAETVEVLEALEPLAEEVYGDLFVPVLDDEPAWRYLNSRTISVDTANLIGVKSWPEDGRVMFPIRGFDRKLYGWTGRSYMPDVKAKVWNLKGVDKSCHLLGAELCTCERPIVVVEGLMFYARLHDMNIQDELGMDVVAAMGSAMSFEQADLLAQVGQPVILFLDGDKAGKLGTWGDEKKGTEGAVHLLARALPTYYVTYPGRIQDPDDLTDDMVLEMLRNTTQFVRRRKRNVGQ